MIDPQTFYNELTKRGTGVFAGVPDSLLKHFCAFIQDHCPADKHIITANEGNAVALAAGHYLSTGETAAVYMQNSGLGNCVNPLTSLVDPEVYSIPVLLIIGWRGEPGVKDEPQHVKQGRITPGQLDVLEIPYQVLQADSNPEQILDQVFATMQERSAPAALLVRKGTFAQYKGSPLGRQEAALTREETLAAILDLTGPDDLFISTTGKTSRELFELRARRGESQLDFLTVGSMGHTSSIALGAALGNPGRRIICLDGDGSLIMHMGSMAVTGSHCPTNLVHVLLNNKAHESVGGQPTVADRMDFAAIARACGYRAYHGAGDIHGLEQAWQEVNNSQGPQLLEVTIRTGSREELGRPTSTPQQNKQAFMQAAQG